LGVEEQRIKIFLIERAISIFTERVETFLIEKIENSSAFISVRGVV